MTELTNYDKEIVIAEAAKTASLPLSAPLPDPQVYAANRRFDLVTLFVIIFGYAALFAIGRALRVSPVIILVFGGYVTCVGIGQALLFGGRHPRAASMIIGVILLMVMIP